MFRTVRQAAICSLALAAFLVATNTSFAGCSGGGYRGHYRHYPVYHAPVVRHVVKPIVHVAPPVVVSQPVKVAPQLPSVPAGSTLSLPGNFLGPDPGYVFLVLNEVKLPVKIEAWNPNGVTITLPPMAVKQPSPARIDVVMPQGQLVNKVEILLTCPAPLVIHQPGPAAPLPTGPAAPLQASAPQIGSPVVLNQ